ncbi:hypothetical protein [Tenuifilum thalassicum]|uniref:Porin family protein n=1 Tax=Tenuifilum thalassicum TaxID=2590900 RepID=A0A7D3XM07_9BACT|nr:hypothetical protein [Tenuifilum thalassicum]QKG79836.1 hypothetical protein FHG85_06035 [Tenuifilum thalassicum]
MRRVVVILVVLELLVFANIAHAQLVQDLYRIYEPVYNPSQTLDSSANSSPYGSIKPGLNYGLTIGSGYTFMGNGIGMSGSYLSPSVTYSNNRLQVMAGVTLSRNNMHGIKPNDIISTSNTNQFSNPYHAWAITQYQFNNRFSMYAAGSISQNQTLYLPYQNTLGTFSSQQFGVGFNYKINKNTTIGASFNFVNGNNLSPWRNSFTPFGW